MPQLKQIMEALERLAPLHYAEKWDNVGLMLGSRTQEVSKVLCALDLNEAVVDEAIAGGYQCIVTHHPFIFKPLAKLDLDTPQGKLIERLMVYRIAVYSMHTNYDIAPGGLNDFLCAAIGLEQVDILEVTQEEQLSKLAVYVPETHVEAVRNVIINENKCRIGKYTGCTFSSLGEGTFIPLEGSKPYIGNKEQVEYVKERKIECVTYQREVTHLFEAIKKVHPYEEVAFDAYPLSNMKSCVGIGRVGVLPQPLCIEAFVQHLKQVFGISHLRISTVNPMKVQKVALCSGSGASFIKKAHQVADIYITGDLKFHEAQEAQILGLPVVDVGHYASEQIAMGHIANYLSKQYEMLEVNCSKVNGETLMIK